MWKQVGFIAALLISGNGLAEDTTVNGTVWSVQYNTGSAFYSAAQDEQEITLECLLGNMTFAVNDDETGEDFNSHDDKLVILIDNVAYKAPVTLQERTAFYQAVTQAKSTIRYRTASGFETKTYPIKELRQFFQSIEFDLSDCKE